MLQENKIRKSLVYRAFFARGVKKYLERIPYVRRLYSGWSKLHPFDVSHGTDTSGYVSVEGITGDTLLRRQINPYAASQPSIVRAALKTLPSPQDYSFIDLGCGKGRVTVIASELPFKQIIGVELSPELANVARSNSAKVHARFPGRTPITIVTGNAVQYTLPPGKVVMFLCHSFGRELVAELIRQIDHELASGRIEHFMFMYYNPVHGDLFDALPELRRWYAQVLPYDDSEIGYGPDLEDAMVIWQSAQGAHPTSHPGSDRRIIIHKPLWTAGLAS